MVVRQCHSVGFDFILDHKNHSMRLHRSLVMHFQCKNVRCAFCGFNFQFYVSFVLLFIDIVVFFQHEILFVFTFSFLLFLQCPVREYNMDDLELDQVTQVIGYHPRFLDHFLRTQNFIMNGDGPLPYDYRYYLAIIVSTR